MDRKVALAKKRSLFLGQWVTELWLAVSRKAIIRTAEPFLEPGEAIQEAFVASGRHPDAAGQPGAQGRRVVVTDRATLLLIPNRKTPLRWDCTRLPRTKLAPGRDCSGPRSFLTESAIGSSECTGGVSRTPIPWFL